MNENEISNVNIDKNLNNAISIEIGVAIVIVILIKMHCTLASSSGLSILSVIISVIKSCSSRHRDRADKGQNVQNSPYYSTTDD